jgi:hypothetical protein
LFLAPLFNQPKFCSTPVWNRNGITFADQSIIGSSPRTIFINAKDSVYILNQGKNQILVWDDNHINLSKTISGNFSNSSSIFVSLNGDIYIDVGQIVNNRVEKWISSTNTFVTVMNVYSSCYSLFVDTNDNLYCSMYNHHQVAKSALHDSLMTLAIVAGTGTRGSASNELDHPHGIFVDAKFDLYVADCENDRVQLFRSGATGITVAGRGSFSLTIALDCPTGITFDAQKYFFIVDSNNHRIVRSGINGFRCLVGCNGQGSQSTQLSFPSSLTFDRSGNMFVVDQKNNRIQKFQYSENSCGKLKIIE